MAISNSALAVLNKQADRIISPTPLAVGSAVLLPAPYDGLHVAGIFVKMGYELSCTFGLPTDWTVLREISVAMADGMTTVFADAWSAILSQRDHIIAIAYAVGHCFKEYYNLILTADRYLMPYEMGLLTENTLYASLNYEMA
jgi:hypothetical protein